MRSEVKKAFNPEFLNRLDEVILFTSLTDEDLIKIIGLLVDQVNLNLVAKQVKLRLAPDASKYILAKTCGELLHHFGGRPRFLGPRIFDGATEPAIG